MNEPQHTNENEKSPSPSNGSSSSSDSGSNKHDSEGEEETSKVTWGLADLFTYFDYDVYSSGLGLLTDASNVTCQ